MECTYASFCSDELKPEEEEGEYSRKLLASIKYRISCTFCFAATGPSATDEYYEALVPKQGPYKVRMR
jgi:hypothetical protein